jgi:hypothetical protein
MRTRYILLAASLIAGGTGIAGAQQAGRYDPSQLPAIQGTVGQYSLTPHSLTPRGDVDGLILTDGTEVHMPPHHAVGFCGEARRYGDGSWPARQSHPNGASTIDQE